MNGILDLWTMTNTVIVMFALGMSYTQNTLKTPSATTLLRVVIAYNLLLPLAGLAIVNHSGWFTPHTVAAMALCIAAAGGTSAGTFVQQTGGSAVLAAKLIVILAGVSLVAVMLLAQTGWISLGALSFTNLAVYLSAITLLPLIAGQYFRRIAPIASGRWQPRAEKAGSLLVVLLVVALAAQYGRDILTGPVEPLLAAVILVSLFLTPLLLEKSHVVRRTAVLVTLIRNLTLVLAILAVMPQAEHLLPTVLAFGLFMYVATGILVWKWKYSLCSTSA